MKKYEVSREIYNPCAEVYIFDNNFFREIETDNIEKTISERGCSGGSCCSDRG